MRSLLVLEDRASRAAPRRSAASRSSRSASTPTRRPRPRRCCGRWASRTSGPHRSKPVQLWQHGEIRIVLNHGAATRTPRSSRSPSRAPTRSAPPRGPRRCSRRCSTAAATRARPTSRPSRRPTAPPCSSAARGLARRLPRARRAGDGRACRSTRIDHITLAQPFEAFDEAGLFYRSVLDLRPGASAELAAPGGLVRSRAFASADGDVRIALNVPALAGTQRGRPSSSTSPSPATTPSRRRARCATRRAAPARSPATTTTISRPASTSTPRC